MLHFQHTADLVLAFFGSTPKLLHELLFPSTGFMLAVLQSPLGVAFPFVTSEVQELEVLAHPQEFLQLLAFGLHAVSRPVLQRETGRKRR